MTGLDDMRLALERCTPPEGLNDRVIARMHAMRSERQGVEAGMGPANARGRGWVRRTGAHCRPHGARAGGEVAVSRRGFVGVGAAACLGLGIAGLGLAAWLRAGMPGEDRSAAARPFGLAVARADDEEAALGRPVALEARPGGLMPMGDETSHSIGFKMNLACVGEGVETATYTIVGSPTWVGSGIPDSLLQEYDRVSFGLKEVVPLDGDYRGSLPPNILAMLDDPSTLTVDLSRNPGWNGEVEMDRGTVCCALWVTSPDDFWQLDPVLAAKKAWLDGKAGVDVDPAREEELERRYIELFAEVSADEETLRAWLASVHAKALRLAADTLATTTLEVEATFSDGARERRTYRIGPVGDFEEVTNGRFAALVERFGIDGDAYRYELAPFWSFAGYLPAEDEPDSRLTRPLFTISDATDA